MCFVIIASGRVFTVVTDVNLHCWNPDKAAGAAAHAREENITLLITLRRTLLGRTWGEPEEWQHGGVGRE